MAFVSILFAFAFTIAAIALGKNLLPRDAGRAYAINGSKSVGKPRGAGMIFILTFTVTCALFVNLSAELIIYLILVLAAMLSGYLDDSASSPWGNLKKGLIDLAISVMAAVTYLHYNPNTFDLAFFGKTVTLNPIIYAILIIILIWVSINVTNCSDGVDGLCGTLSVVTLASVFVLFKSFNIESAYRHTVLIMIVCILGYLWFNASPSKLLMGDAGSRAIGMDGCLSRLMAEGQTELAAARPDPIRGGFFFRAAEQATCCDGRRQAHQVTGGGTQAAGSRET